MSDPEVSPALIELLDLYKIEKERTISDTGKNIVEIFSEVLDSCIRCTAVAHWLHITTEGGRFWVGLYLIGAATEIGNRFCYDPKICRLALGFALLGKDIFDGGGPLDGISLVLKLPEIELDSESPIYGRNNLGAHSARKWIESDFQGMFPTSNLTTMLQLYENYSLPAAQNIEGQTAYKSLFKNMSPSIKLKGNSVSKMLDDHNITSNVGGFRGIMKNDKNPSNTKIVFEYLAEEGYRPNLENDYSIKLKVEGAVFWVDLNEDDDELYKVIAAFIWQIDSPAELANAYIAASEASRTTKVAKVYVTADEKNVWVSTQLFYNDANSYVNVLSRALSATKSAKKRFIEVIRELEAERQAKLTATFTDDNATLVEIQLFAKRENEIVWSTTASYLPNLGTISDIADPRFGNSKKDDEFAFYATHDGEDLEVIVDYKDEGNSFCVEVLPF